MIVSKMLKQIPAANLMFGFSVIRIFSKHGVESGSLAGEAVLGVLGVLCGSY